MDLRRVHGMRDGILGAMSSRNGFERVENNLLER